MHQLLQTVSNPGIYVETVGPLTNALMYTSLVAAALGVIAVSFEKKVSPRWLRTVFVSAAAFGFIALASFVVSIVAFNLARDAAVDAYQETVTGWLASDYGVTAGAAATQKLAYGQALIMNLDGELQVISLVESSSGDLKVVDRAGDVIPPNSRD